MDSTRRSFFQMLGLVPVAVIAPSISAEKLPTTGRMAEMLKPRPESFLFRRNRRFSLEPGSSIEFADKRVLLIRSVTQDFVSGTVYPPGCEIESMP